MARRNSFHRHQSNRAVRAPIVVRTAAEMRGTTTPKQYGKPFVLLEDDRKQTFQFQAGAWVPYERSIAECRVDCDVKQLAQKVNNMTRYEVRLPL